MLNDQSTSLTHDELTNLYFITNVDKIENRRDLSENEITEILEYANKKFNEITENTNSSKNIRIHRVCKYEDYNRQYSEYGTAKTEPVFYFSNPSTRLALLAVIKEGKNSQCVLSYIASIPKIVNNKVEFQDLPSTLRTALVGKNIEANLQSACLAEAIKVVIGTRISGVGFSRTCQDLRMASLINPEAFDKVVLVAGLGPNSAQINQALQLRQHFNKSNIPDEQLENDLADKTLYDEQLENDLADKTLYVSSRQTDHVVDYAPIIGFEDLARVANRQLLLPINKIRDRHFKIHSHLKEFLKKKLSFEDIDDRVPFRENIARPTRLNDYTGTTYPANNFKRHVSGIKASMFDRGINDDINKNNTKKQKANPTNHTTDTQVDIGGFRGMVRTTELRIGRPGY